MSKSKCIYTAILFLVISSSQSSAQAQDSETGDDSMTMDLELSIGVPIGGNSWVSNSETNDQSIISENGIDKWKQKDKIIRTYFKTFTNGRLNIGLNVKKSNGTSKIKVTVGQESKEIEIKNSDNGIVEVGSFEILNSGYHYVQIEGIDRTSDYFPELDKIWIGGESTLKGVIYVEDDFYWGRRGPSVHLSYVTPKDKDISWFYNEIIVPEGEDTLGSYYMANGFGEGYFGIQVNSETERRVLFSVWSPYDTQDPNEIPEGYQIKLLKKGDNVTTGEFGNEGAGGQSYKIYDWNAGDKYRFLLKGEPSVNNSTDYTAYFYAPEEGAWQLVASFRRPYTKKYLTRPHSFLENFLTETGFISRKGMFMNQWVRDTQGAWHELTKAKFTADATARKRARLDYAGGAQGNTFFMENCGFFNENTPIDTYHERTANELAPEIDFSTLK